MPWDPESSEEPKAGLGMQLGILAAAMHWISAVLLILGIFMANVAPSNDDAQALHDKYPDRFDRLKVMNNFTHPDSVALNLDRLNTMYDVQGFLVFEGLMESISCVLAICTLMCVKAQINYNSMADEKELCTYACLLLGLLVPMLEFCMRAGPVSFVGWVGHEVSKTEGEQFFSDFEGVQIQMMVLMVQTVESLFVWLNTFADLLLGIGFMQLAFIGSARADIIFSNATRLVGLWTGALFLLAALCGMLRELPWGNEHPLYLAMELTVMGVSVALALFLVPTFFVLVALGLGRVDSVERLNNDLADALAASQRKATTERLKAKNVQKAVESAGNPVGSELEVADD